MQDSDTLQLNEAIPLLLCGPRYDEKVADSDSNVATAVASTAGTSNSVVAGGAVTVKDDMNRDSHEEQHSVDDN